MSLELFALSIAAKAMCSRYPDLPGAIGTSIDGIIGNRADDLVRNLAARMRKGGLPANHHVQQAGQTALRETLKLLVSAVAAEVGGKPPLWDALRRHLRAGTLSHQPLLEIRNFPECQWLENLQALAEDAHALEDLHRRLPFDEASVVAALRSDAESEQAGRRFDAALAGWINEHMAERPARPGCLDAYLSDGFPLERGGRERVRPFQAWRLVFAEAAKTTPEVFNILVLRTLADLSGRVASALPGRQAFEQALSAPVASIQAALGRIEADLDAIKAGQQEEIESLGGLHDKADGMADTQQQHGAKLDGLRGQNDSLHNKFDALTQTIQQSIQTYRPGALHQLNRRLPEHFTGRAGELEQLIAALRQVGAGFRPRLEAQNNRGLKPAPTPPGAAAVVISAVNGMGGVGKTALALMAAYAVLDASPTCNCSSNSPPTRPALSAPSKPAMRC